MWVFAGLLILTFVIGCYMYNIRSILLRIANALEIIASQDYEEYDDGDGLPIPVIISRIDEKLKKTATGSNVVQGNFGNK